MTDPVTVGIDVSKTHLDVAARPGDHFRVGNDPAGIADLVARLRRLAPALVVATARGPRQVAWLALLATLATSVTGLAAYTVLEAIDVGARPAAADWLIGTITGLGGLAGSLLGAGLQPRLDERLLTCVLAVLVTAVAVVHLLRG